MTVIRVIAERIVASACWETTMSAQGHYKRLAEHCMRAARCTDPEIAKALRILAADYLSSANEPPVGQQGTGRGFRVRRRKK